MPPEFAISHGQEQEKKVYMPCISGLKFYLTVQAPTVRKPTNIEIENKKKYSKIDQKNGRLSVVKKGRILA